MFRSALPAWLLLATSVFAQNDPVFHWRLDETGGPTAYASAGSENGSLVGGVLWAPAEGHHQGAARFDGVNDRIILGACDLVNGGQAITLSLWVKPDFVTGMERTLIAKTIGADVTDHVWSIAFMNATALHFRLKAGGSTTDLGTPPSSLFGGTWYHIVATYDGSEMKLYTNGALMAATAKSGSIGYHPQAPAAIGAHSTGTHPTSAWIDDVRIYDRALTEQEIIALLFESITTAVHENNISLTDGRLNVNTIAWERMWIHDHMGRIIEQRTRTGTTDIDLQPLPAGVYTVCLQRQDAQWVQRVFVP